MANQTRVDIRPDHESITVSLQDYCGDAPLYSDDINLCIIRKGQKIGDDCPSLLTYPLDNIDCGEATFLIDDKLKQLPRGQYLAFVQVGCENSSCAITLYIGHELCMRFIRTDKFSNDGVTGLKNPNCAPCKPKNKCSECGCEDACACSSDALYECPPEIIMDDCGVLDQFLADKYGVGVPSCDIIAVAECNVDGDVVHLCAQGSSGLGANCEDIEVESDCGVDGDTVYLSAEGSAGL